MRSFLKRLGRGALKLIATFVIIAIAARFLEPLNWFFFQKKEHHLEFLTMTAMEQILAEGKPIDLLILGCSATEYAIDPQQLSQLTGLKVFKFVSGGQTTDMSVHLAHYLAPRLHAKYVLFDAFPRFGPGLAEEGVERIVLNAPQANSELTRTVLETNPYSFNTNYIWAAKAIGTILYPYPEDDLDQVPSFEIVEPGFARSAYSASPVQVPYQFMLFPHDAITLLNDAHATLKPKGHEVLAILPAIQHGRVILESRPHFPVLAPHPLPDTCFWDNVHLRATCVAAYTAEIARLFNDHRRHVSHAP